NTPLPLRVLELKDDVLHVDVPVGYSVRHPAGRRRCYCQISNNFVFPLLQPFQNFVPRIRYKDLLLGISLESSQESGFIPTVHVSGIGALTAAGLGKTRFLPSFRSTYSFNATALLCSVSCEL